MLPVLFVSHGGGPGIFMDFKGSTFSEIDKSSQGATFMRSLRDVLPPSEQNPIKCILTVSAHWEESSFTIGYQPGETKLLYDYYGFPKEAYAPYLTYPAPTDLNVVQRIEMLLKHFNIESNKINRGFDHGVFIPLKAAFPEAKIPVVQLSLKTGLDPNEHVRLGEALFSLRSEGVLIICSGQITHNLADLHNPSSNSIKKSIQFTQWVFNLLTEIDPSSAGSICKARNELVNVETLAPHYTYCHPRTEHFLPLHVAFGAAFPSVAATTHGAAIASDVSGKECGAVKRIYHQMVLGGMSLDSYLFY